MFPSVAPDRGLRPRSVPLGEARSADGQCVRSCPARDIVNGGKPPNHEHSRQTESTEEPTAQQRCKMVLWLLLSFAERNPGLARLMLGDALQGETERLRNRVRQLFDRLETQLRLILREWAVTRVPGPELGSTAGANLMLSAAEGRINQFVRSEFRALPTSGWEEQWQALERAIFH